MFPSCTWSARALSKMSSTFFVYNRHYTEFHTFLHDSKFIYNSKTFWDFNSLCKRCAKYLFMCGIMLNIQGWIYEDNLAFYVIILGSRRSRSGSRSYSRSKHDSGLKSSKSRRKSRSRSRWDNACVCQPNFGFEESIGLSWLFWSFCMVKIYNPSSNPVTGSSCGSNSCIWDLLFYVCIWIFIASRVEKHPLPANWFLIIFISWHIYYTTFNFHRIQLNINEFSLWMVMH